MELDDATRAEVVRRAVALHGKKRFPAHEIIFLSVDPDGRRDPSPALLKALSGGVHTFAPLSQATRNPNGVYARRDRRRGSYLTLSRVRAIGKGLVAVDGSVWRAVRDGTAWVVVLRRRASAWEVTDARIRGQY